MTLMLTKGPRRVKNLKERKEKEDQKDLIVKRLILWRRLLAIWNC